MAIGLWLVAAFLVITAQHAFGNDFVLCAAAKLAIIVLAAFAYMNLAARRATLDRALLVGAAWLLLCVVVEVTMSTHVHHAWTDLLGSPDHPVVRDVLLIAWVATPMLFARRRA
jgi:hypothetical protein